MAINDTIGRKRSFADISIEGRISPDEHLLQVDRMGQETGLWRAVDRELRRLYSAEGRPGYPPLVLFKCLLLGLMYDLSARDTERALRRDLLFMKFVGLGMDDPVPDHSLLSVFKDRIKDTEILESALEHLERSLERRGLVLKKGAIVDATIVPAVSRDDPDAKWVKRGNKRSTFGFKATISVDKDTLTVRGVCVSPAHEHDTKFFEDVLPGDVGEVYADKGYDDKERRRRLREQGIKPKILRRAKRNKPLNAAEKRWNKQWAKKRSLVETVFGNLKNLFGLRRSRWKGLASFRLQTQLASVAWNLFHAARMCYA